MKETVLTKKILDYLKKNISAKKLDHTKSTAEYAVKMAGIYKVDKKKVEIAALLHDCAKEESDRAIMKMATAYGFEIDDMYINTPQLLHGVAAAYVSKKKFDIKDDDILEAICYHTVPKPNMCKLAKIIFIADKIEKTRTFDDLKAIRKAVDKHEKLDVVFLMTLKGVKISHIMRNRPLHPKSLQTYNHIVSNM